jgi:HAD superfamily hydrolase (TIGR01509 family)
MRLADKKFWIFDMDGTLTIPAHDFDAIRRELGLSLGKPILEQLSELAAETAEPLYRRLDEIERDIALRARPQPGAQELLTGLRDRGMTLGILTRNSRLTALETLRRCGLEEFFDERHVMSREGCALKPSGDGVKKLLELWRASPADAVMVGDYLFDIMAGREAGTTTVFIDNLGRIEFARRADCSVKSLHELLVLIDPAEQCGPRASDD